VPAFRSIFLFAPMLIMKSSAWYPMWHSAATFESCWRYQIRSVGVRSCSSSHVSEASVSLPACFNARIAIAVSRMSPQLSSDFRFSNSATQ